MDFVLLVYWLRIFYGIDSNLGLFVDDLVFLRLKVNVKIFFDNIDYE